MDPGQMPRYRSGLSEALASPAYHGSTPNQNAGDSPVDNASTLLTNHNKKVSSSLAIKRRLGKPVSALSPAALEASGVITPALLAKHHLPDILLCHGPLTLRHIMAYLTTTVPGFSGVSLPKQRKLVTSALEGHHNGSSFSAGIDGDIMFEKIGSNKWIAKKHSNGATVLSPMRIPQTGSAGAHLKPPSDPHAMILDSPETGAKGAIQWKRESGVFLHDEDVEGTEKIALDDEDVQMATLDVASSSDCITQETTTDISGPMDDSTDEEDWASIGAEGVRNPASIPSGGSHGIFLSKRQGMLPGHMSGLPRSLPWESRINASTLRKNHTNVTAPSNAERAREEQEAIEALVKLGSF